MKPSAKRVDDLKMSAANFDKIMRGALQAPAPKKQPKKGTRTKKPKEKAAK